jgi:hypothetical protein
MFCTGIFKIVLECLGLSLCRLAVPEGVEANKAWQGCNILGPSCIAWQSWVTQLVYKKIL